jgi:hypothetical protein
MQADKLRWWPIYWELTFILLHMFVKLRSSLKMNSNDVVATSFVTNQAPAKLAMAAPEHG